MFTRLAKPSMQSHPQKEGLSLVGFRAGSNFQTPLNFTEYTTQRLAGYVLGRERL